MSQPFLFYSERCPHSKQIIDTLKALNKASLYKFILVESIPRAQIPPFLKMVPTLYVPDTKEAITGKDIYGYIAKPTNSRKELPTKEPVASGGGSATISGDLQPWGFEGTGSLSESYSMWNAPSEFTKTGNSMFTFITESPVNISQGGLPAAAGPDTENTIKSKTGSNGDVMSRLEAMNKQREKEFAGVTRK